MSKKTLKAPKLSIAAAGARLREIVPQIMDIEAATVAPGVSEAARAMARRSLVPLDAEVDALRTYIACTPAITAVDVLVQFDAMALEADGHASDEDIDPKLRKFLERMFLGLASAAGVLSKIAGKGLDEFTATGLDQTYAVAFPLAARSTFAAAHLN